MLKSEGFPKKCIDSVKFTAFSADEIRKLSVKQITNPNSLDALKNPNQNGLYDTDLGPFGFDDACGTCKCGRRTCTGHFSHIELPVPVYNPVYFSTIVWFLKASCLHCQRLTIESPKLVLILYKMQALQDGMFSSIQHFEDIYNSIVGESAGEKDGLVALISERLISAYNKEKEKVVRQYDEEDFFQMSRNSRQLQIEMINEFQVLTRKGTRCLHCGRKKPPIRTEYNAKIYMTVEEDGKTTSQYMTPILVLRHFNAVWKHDSGILAVIFSAFQDINSRDLTKSSIATDKPLEEQTNVMDLFFINALSVPPPRFRPCRFIGDMCLQSPESENYSKIVLDCAVIRLLASTLNDKDIADDDLNTSSQFLKTDKNLAMLQNVPGQTKADKLQNAWSVLQNHVNALYDSDMDKSQGKLQEVSKANGMKQLLEKKDGLFRSNMMGKRVNFAARSVISPDPYIATNEIGVPLVFATKLTFPEPVTPWNAEKLWHCVVNGPNVHPGATRVITGSGSVILLSADDKEKRISVAKKLTQVQGDGKSRKKGLLKPNVVLRHIQDGDFMLVNRQPTLHKGSMMAHTVRVLPKEKTLRLHYANCKSYNADFDGDEMNAHFPQSELCRSEAINLMSTNTQYLSGKDGSPLSGLIQDHMVAGVNISVRGRFFDCEKYQQLVYCALAGFRKRIKLLPPTILKPKVMWSGKQVFSTLLINLCPKGKPFMNLISSSKIGDKEWQTGMVRSPVVANLGTKEMSEHEVIIRNGILLCGVLDKNHYGASRFGLVHATHELYSGVVSGQLLTSLARLFTAFLQQYRGFTLSVSDILVTKPANKTRHHIIANSHKLGLTELARMFGIKNENDKEAILSRLQDAHLRSMVSPVDEMAAVDHEMKRLCAQVNDSIAKACMGPGLIKRFPKNNLQLMVISGAKGGAVNCMQISCLLGQIELEGRRPPLLPSGRTAPSFAPYDTTLRAGGFVSQRFLTGIRPQEYFYHCMAGREGLIDTAVKTSRSGYLQRCLIKHLEGLVLNYDLTVRDSDGSIVQFLYGEDGLDVCRSDYLTLEKNSLKFLAENYEAELCKFPSMEEIKKTSIDLKKANKAWKKMKKKVKSSKGLSNERISHLSMFMEQKGITNPKVASEMWHKIPIEERRTFIEQYRYSSVPDPPLAHLQPDLYINSTSEKFREVVKENIKKNPWELKKKRSKKDTKPTKKEFESLLNLKYQCSLSPPGTCVGVTAAQSVGEPSTQMTLNTFHFAGRGEMNVTLGIPRLREILMVASHNISTPQMTVPVKEGMREAAEKLQKQMTCITLDKVLHKINTQQYFNIKPMTRRSQRADIIIHLLPEKKYKDELCLRRKEVFKYIENIFIRRVMVEINNQIKQRRSEALVMTQRVARELSRTMNGENTEEPTEDDLPIVDGSNEDSRDAADEESAKQEAGEDDVEYDDGDSDAEENNAQDDDEEGEEGKEVEQDSQDDGEDENQQEMEADQLLRVSKVQRMIVGQVTVQSYEYTKHMCKIVLDLPITDAPVDLAAILKQEATKGRIRHVPGITRSIVQVDPYDSSKVNFVTEGINFHKMFEHENILDITKMYSNCVHSMANTYGIEAAARVITKEIQNVFAVYGIGVDPRHLNLISDYMCFEGEYLAFNRMGMTSCASPLQQMTFETTMKFLKNSTLSATWDPLKSPSARIVAGQIVKGGTGVFDIKVPYDVL